MLTNRLPLVLRFGNDDVGQADTALKSRKDREKFLRVILLTHPERPDVPRSLGLAGSVFPCRDRSGPAVIPIKVRPARVCTPVTERWAVDEALISPCGVFRLDRDEPEEERQQDGDEPVREMVYTACTCTRAAPSVPWALARRATDLA